MSETEEEVKTFRINIDYFAAHCPLTLADAYHCFMQKPDIGEPTSEQVMAKFVEMRFEYANKMAEESNRQSDE